MAPTLQTLSNDALHTHVLETRRTQAGAEWDLALALLEVAERGLHLEHGCSSPTAYAVRFLDLEAQKARELLRVARELQSLPQIREAFRIGRLGWGKLRAITRRATPETEEAWLEFALAHTQPEVEERVVISPRGWKRLLAERESAASAFDAPGPRPALLAPAGAQEAQVSPPPPAATAPAGSFGAPAPLASVTDSGPSSSAPVLAVRKGCGAEVTLQGALLEGACEPPPVATLRIEDLEPAEIQWKANLDPQQFALVEQAERYVRARLGRRASRGEVLAELASLALKAAPSRTRLRYQVFVHLDGDSDQAWFDTGRGLLEVPQEDVSDLLADAEVTVVPKASVDPPGSSGEVDPDGAPPRSSRRNKSRRTPVPVHRIREVYQQARGRCQDCGARGILHLDHEEPWSDTGTHGPLRLRCGPCHALRHRKDFAERPDWRQARERAMAECGARRKGEGGSGGQAGADGAAASEGAGASMDPLAAGGEVASVGAGMDQLGTSGSPGGAVGAPDQVGTGEAAPTGSSGGSAAVEGAVRSEDQLGASEGSVSRELRRKRE